MRKGNPPKEKHRGLFIYYLLLNNLNKFLKID